MQAAGCWWPLRPSSLSPVRVSQPCTHELMSGSICGSVLVAYSTSSPSARNSWFALTAPSSAVTQGLRFESTSLHVQQEPSRVGGAGGPEEGQGGGYNPRMQAAALHMRTPSMHRHLGAHANATGKHPGHSPHQHTQREDVRVLGQQLLKYNLRSDCVAVHARGRMGEKACMAGATQAEGSPCDT